MTGFRMVSLVSMLVCITPVLADAERFGLPPDAGADSRALLGSARMPVIQGVVHLEGVGDRQFRGASDWVGSRGEGRRMEAFGLMFERIPADLLRIEYMCHVQDIGDLGWFADGALCGTAGRSLRLEGFQLRLAGSAAHRYSIRYQCHVENRGDLNPDGGGYCGTRGQGLRLEAMRVWLEPRR